MKYLPQIASFVLGSGLTAGALFLKNPPSKLELAIEVGRKLGLAAAEDRYADV